MHIVGLPVDGQDIRQNYTVDIKNANTLIASIIRLVYQLFSSFSYFSKWTVNLIKSMSVDQTPVEADDDKAKKEMRKEKICSCLVKGLAYFMP